MAGLLGSTDQIHEQPKPISPYSRDPYRMLPKIRDRVSGESVEQRWLRTYAETLRGYHRHPETKFLHGEAIDSGTTRRRHIFAEAVEDIGKEADKWDEDEPLSADDEFTVSYGISVADRKQMFAVIQSVSKRQLASAAKVSTRTIPMTVAAANDMPDKELERVFAEASSLVEEQRKIRESDESMLRWLVQQVDERGPKEVAEVLGYDAANLAKVVAGKRRLSSEVRKRIGEQMTEKPEFLPESEV
jgi:predicted regulator of amino acid metabolism with ACT domain